MILDITLTSSDGALYILYVNTLQKQLSQNVSFPNRWFVISWEQFKPHRQGGKLVGYFVSMVYELNQALDKLHVILYGKLNFTLIYG